MNQLTEEQKKRIVAQVTNSGLKGMPALSYAHALAIEATEANQ